MEPSEFASFSSSLQRAEDCFQAGDFLSAFGEYADLLQDRLRAAHDVGKTLETGDELLVVERLTHLATLFGRYDAADALLDGAATLSRAAGNAYAADYSTVQRAVLALACGRLRDAESRLGDMGGSIGDIRAIDMSEVGLRTWEGTCYWPGIDDAGRAVLFSRLYLAFGTLLAALGQYAQARTCLERGSAFSTEKDPELARIIRLHIDMMSASALMEAGMTGDAERLLADIEPRLDAARHPGMRAAWLECSGKLALLQGRFGVALDRFEDLVGLARRYGFERAQAVSMLNLAQLRIVVNQTAAAIDLIESARRVALALGDSTSAARARFLLDLARARSSSMARAVPIAPSVTEMWQGAAGHAPSAAVTTDPLDLPQPRSFLEFFEDRALGFQWSLAQGDLEQAARTLVAMNEVFAATDSNLIHARLDALAGLLAYYRDDLKSAASQLTKTTSRLRDAGLRHDLWQALRVLVWARSRLGGGNTETEALSREANDLLAEMAGSLADAERAIFLLNKWTADEEALASDIDAAVRLRDERRIAPWYLRPALAWRERRATIHLLWRIDRYKALIACRSLGAGQDKQRDDRAPSVIHSFFQWSRGKATVSFLVLPDRTLVILASGRRLTFGVTPVTRVRLRELVRQWHELMSDAFEGRVAKDATHQLKVIATDLSQLLQLPALLRQLPGHTTHLRFIPDDVLHGLPFAAVPVDGSYLVEHYALSTGFEALEARPFRSASRDALLVAISEGGAGHAPLPGAAIEVDRVRPALENQGWRVLQLNDREASPDALLARLPSVGLLHVASHGIFDQGRPDRSGLVLAGDQPSGERLTLGALTDVDLTRLQHATLSACWSADNFVLPGRWIISLPETLCRSGAHSVLGWLWPVPDRYAIAMMESFYQHLARDSRDRALQRVCLASLHETQKELLPPALAELPFWAGLQLYGTCGRLRA